MRAFLALLMLLAATVAHAQTFGSSTGSAVTATSTTNVNSTITAPASTTAFKMQGLAGSITPAVSGNVLITISGTIIANTAVTITHGIKYQISYGTGTAPTNAATLTGTQVGIIAEERAGSTLTTVATPFGLWPFSISYMVTGLVVGTTYWIDLAAESVTTASDHGFTNVNISAVEQALPAVLQTSVLSGPGVSFGPIPNIVYHFQTAVNPNVSGTANNAFKVFTAPTQSGDTVVFTITGPHGQTAALTDSAGDTIPAAVCSADDGTGNFISFAYIIQPTAGTTWINVVWSGAGASLMDYDITEYNNIASATDQGHNCQAGLVATSGLVTPSSVTPTNNDSTGGNLIYNYTALATSPPAGNASGYTPATGYTLYGGDTNNFVNGGAYGYFKGIQTLVQRASAATVASMKVVGQPGGSGDPFNSITISMKIGSSGTAVPTTIHVAQVQQMTADNNAGPTIPSTWVFPVTTLGNARVFAFESPGSYGPANSVTSSDGCNFTRVNSINNPNILWYAQGCSPMVNGSITFHMTPGGAYNNTAFQFYDIENANASSFQNETDTGAGCSTGTSNNNPSFTPSSSSGVSIGMNSIGNGPGGPMVTPSGSVNTCANFTGINDGDYGCFGDWHAYFYYSTNAAQDWDWTIAGTGSTCNATVAAFK